VDSCLSNPGSIVSFAREEHDNFLSLSIVLSADSDERFRYYKYISYHGMQKRAIALSAYEFKLPFGITAEWKL